MAVTLIEINGYELFGKVTATVTATNTETNKLLESRKFVATTLKEIWPEIQKYVMLLRRKYHPARIVNNLHNKLAMNKTLLTKLIRIANELDKKGLYNEAGIADSIIKSAIDYPPDFDPGEMPGPTPEELQEMANQEEIEGMDKEDEYEDKRYYKHMEPTDPNKLDEMSGKRQVKQKLQEGYDTDTDLMLKMKNVLKRFDPAEMAEAEHEYGYADEYSQLPEPGDEDYVENESRIGDVELPEIKQHD